MDFFIEEEEHNLFEGDFERDGETNAPVRKTYV